MTTQLEEAAREALAVLEQIGPLTKGYWLGEHAGTSAVQLTKDAIASLRTALQEHHAPPAVPQECVMLCDEEISKLMRESICAEDSARFLIKRGAHAFAAKNNLTLAAAERPKEPT